MINRACLLLGVGAWILCCSVRSSITWAKEEEKPWKAHIMFSLGSFVPSYPAQDYSQFPSVDRPRLPLLFELGFMWRRDQLFWSFSKPLLIGMTGTFPCDFWVGRPEDIKSAQASFTSQWFLSSQEISGISARLDLGLGATKITFPDETTSTGGSLAGFSFGVGMGYQFPGTQWLAQVRYLATFLGDGPFQFGVLSIGLGY